MNFVTPQFAVFFVTVFVLHWCLPHRARNVMLLLASWVFYAAWDWRFLSLILISTVVDFVAGARLHATQDRTRRRAWLGFSLLVNLGILGYFKYAGFFIDSFVQLATSVGFQPSEPTLNIILPVGISFYTFQTLSYTLDIYRRELEPTRSLVDFATFVAFFPQLVAGPIVRAKEFLHQLSVPRSFSPSTFQAGALRFIEGFFLKAVVADVLAVRLVDPIFADPSRYGSGALWMGMFGYTAQIYADFAGYSSLAIGTALMLGFVIPENFLFPYLATSFSDFWRRWHITMSRFFRDYVYIPLGGSRGPRWRTPVNLAATTLISGLWHGAAWTFVVWGGLHGLFIMAAHILRRVWPNPAPLRAFAGWVVTFFGVSFAWILFRAQTFGDAWVFFRGLWGATGTAVELDPLPMFCLAAVVVHHLAGFVKERRWRVVPVLPLWAKACFYVSLVLIAFHAIPEEANPFIYFQF